jgi:anaerobic ribonucleoside-triphosphate reductase
VGAMETQQKIGVKETKEAIVAFVELAKLANKASQDGLDWNDATNIGIKIIEDEEFRFRMTAAFVSCSKIPSELQDLDIPEMIELASAIFDAFKK